MEKVDLLKELERVKDRMKELLWDYERGKVGGYELKNVICAYKKYSDVLGLLIDVNGQ